MNNTPKDEKAGQGRIGRFFSRLAFRGLGNALEREDPDDPESGLLGGLWIKISDSVGEVIEDQEDHLIEIGAERVGDEVRLVATSVGNRVKEHTGSFFNNLSDALNPSELTNWEIIRNKIDPENNFFRTVFARILHVGCYITSFIGAGVAKLLGNVENEYENTIRHDIESVFALIISMFKLPDPEEDDEEKFNRIIKTRKKKREAAQRRLMQVLTPTDNHPGRDTSPVPIPA